METQCDNCGSNELIESEVHSCGAYGPDLLPGTGFLSNPHFTLRICAQCGKVFWWVKGKNLEKVKKSKKFKPIR